MAFVRLDLQVTEEQSVAIAAAIGPILKGFPEAYKRMMDRGADDGKHMAVMWRSTEVQAEMDRDA